MITNNQRAEILAQALPHIQEYNGKIIVVKYGGNAMINESLKSDVMQDIVLLNLIGVKVVLVHGGGPELSALLKRLGHESKFVNGLRVTDDVTAEAALMVLSGKINKKLVAKIGSFGGRAIGLSGLDSCLITAKTMDPELGYVGDITGINAQPIMDLLEKGYIPVVSTVGCDADENIYNINADTAAAEIAAALNAESLVSMTDTPGLLRDKDDPSTLISAIDVAEIPTLIEEGVISGGMIPKVGGMVEAIANGVKKVFIIDGRLPHAILVETLTDEGIGTMFVDKSAEA
ncbi:MAG: acetylglutamate kinase [Clostridia bacterium]|nr:acetylglutamate kinase [Oscillospiraceae bacterium]MBQ1955826.1 acetylglutamate kinase [Clostridia bacterium]